MHKDKACAKITCATATSYLEVCYIMHVDVYTLSPKLNFCIFDKRKMLQNTIGILKLLYRNLFHINILHH